MSDDIREAFHGNALDVARTVPGVIPADPVTRARFVLKRHWWDADGAALIVKDITTANTSAGQVTQTGAVGDGNGIALLLFHLLAGDTAMPPAEVLTYYDVRVWFASGNGYTIQPTGGKRWATAIFKRRIGVATT